MAIAEDQLEQQILETLSNESLEPIELFARLKPIDEAYVRRAVIQLLVRNKVELNWDRKLVKL